MKASRVTMTATVLVLALAAARAEPYVGTDDDGNLQLRSATGHEHNKTRRSWWCAATSGRMI